MNKDVIYIEPEDDITDIITKIENSKEKIVALVPPKKASVFRSIVNLKLVAKAGVTSGKSVVIVTTDPSIVKLAAAVKLPVTKDLKSAPAVPKSTEGGRVVEEAEVVEVDATEGESTEGADTDAATDTENAESAEPAADGESEVKLDGKTGFLDEELAADEAKEQADETEKKPASKDEKEKKATDKSEKAKAPALKSNNPTLRWMQEHKKVLIVAGVGVVALVIFLIWGFIIAPAAEVTVGIRTTATNFSENVSFTEKMADENASEGKFYLEEKKLENKAEVEFAATGKKNVGEKASGTLTVYAYVNAVYGGTYSLAAGTAFTYNNMQFVVSEQKVFSYDPDNDEAETVCDNAKNLGSVSDYREFQNTGCLVSRQVSVAAAASGSSYNVKTSGNGWSVAEGVFHVLNAETSGGTDKTVTVVQQSDIDKAKAQLEAGDESANKQKLLATIADDAFIIDASFKQTVGDAVSSPAVGEEVKDDEKAKLSVTTIDTIYIIDGTKVEEFIREKAKLAENFKIYEMNDPFIENFTKTDGGYVAKLKTSYVSGPKITEAEVAEVVKGKGVGTARQDLEKAYDGISHITIQTNYPWVSKIPNDNNKVTVNIEVDSQ